MPNPIRPGTRPFPATPSGPSPARPSGSGGASGPGDGFDHGVSRTYTVQPGDSLAVIASRHGTTVDALVAANGLANPDRIFGGQDLVIPGGSGGTAPAGALSRAGEHQFTFDDLWPTIQHYATVHGADARVMAAIIRQESSFQNHVVHDDGTGHGLIGLDDNGRKPEFERWSHFTVGRGRSSRAIPPELQIEFLAKTLADSTSRYGDSMAAAREWHRGAGGMNDRRGHAYQRLIEGHIRRLF